MRKFLFYSFCTGCCAAYAFAARWVIRSIADAYGLFAMAVFTIGAVVIFYLIARRIDRADAKAAAATDCRPEQEPERAAIGYSRTEAD